MRSSWFTFSLCLFLLLGTMSVLSGGHAAAKSGDGKTQVVTDEQAHVVRVIIDGKEVLTIDAKGLHVNGNVEYSGTIRDTGR